MGLDELYTQYEKENPNITIKATNIDTGGQRPDRLADQAGSRQRSPRRAGRRRRLARPGHAGLRPVHRPQATTASNDRQAAGSTGSSSRPPTRTAASSATAPTSVRRASATTASCSRLPACRATARTSPSSSAATTRPGRTTSRSASSTRQATGKAFYDQSGFVWNAMVNQLPEGYYTKDGELNVEDNADLKARWGQLAGGAAAGLSVGQTQWDWGKGKAFTDGSFATFVCPGWMLGVVQGQVEAGGGDASTGWDFADVFPGGAANWGGSFLTVPDARRSTRRRPLQLAAWLTDAESQVASLPGRRHVPVGHRGAERPRCDRRERPDEVLQQRTPRRRSSPIAREGRRRPVQGPGRLGHPGAGLRSVGAVARHRQG